MSDVYSNFVTRLWLLQNLEQRSKVTAIQDISPPVPCTFADGDKCRESRVTKQSQISGMLTEFQF